MQNQNKNKNKHSKNNSEKPDIIIAGTLQETVSRYGSAASEYIKGYEGRDNLTGTIFDKGHKQIHTYKTHPDYTEQNLKQQAGYNAEVLKVSRENAENRINNRPERVIRTADHPDFGKNDMVNDHVVVDGNNNVVDGLQSQMKFVDNYERLIDKIAKGGSGGKNDLSRYLDTKLDLPSDQYQQAKEYCLSEAKNLREQAVYLKETNPQLAEQKLFTAKNYEKVHNNIQDSKITTQEAMAYRLNPELSTIKDIMNTAHEAGENSAKIGASIGFIMSAIKNLLALKAKESQNIEVETIFKNIALDTGKSAIKGYIIAAGGTLAKSTMEQYGCECLQRLSQTGAPGAAVAFIINLNQSIVKFIRGQITGLQFLEEIGQKGSNTIAGTLFAAIGQAAIPIPFAGAAIGSLIGYTISSLSYKELTISLKEAKLSEEHYLKVKQECEEARSLMDMYLYENEKFFKEQFNILKDDVDKYFAVIDNLIIDAEYQDVDGICKAVNEIGLKVFNTELKYNTREECHQLMLSDEKLIL